MDSGLLSLKTNLIISALEMAVIAFIYCIPALSHLIPYPLFLFEPMQLGLFLLIGSTHKKNVWLMAFTIPIFSYLVSGHPVFPKMLLMTGELTFNVFLFYQLARIVSGGIAVATSILLSKIFYYFGKYLFIKLSFLTGELISTPLSYQFLVMLSISLAFFVYGFLKKRPTSK